MVSSTEWEFIFRNAKTSRTQKHPKYYLLTSFRAKLEYSYPIWYSNYDIHTPTLEEFRGSLPST